MVRSRLALTLAAAVMVPAQCSSCHRPATPRPAVSVAAARQLDLRAYVFVDADFVPRFGSPSGAGRERVNNWLWESGKQLGLVAPVRVSLAGVGEWKLPHGALDGTAIFRKYVPESWPESSGGNCMMAITGRRGVYWSGVSQWPRLFLKAQEHQPVDSATVSVLVHEISHWFGTRDIIDASFPEPSVMNYKDRAAGYREGRLRWDEQNLRRLLDGVETRAAEEGTMGPGELAKHHSGASP